jgi:hypothetical protein
LSSDVGFSRAIHAYWNPKVLNVVEVSLASGSPPVLAGFSSATARAWLNVTWSAITRYFENFASDAREARRVTDALGDAGCFRAINGSTFSIAVSAALDRLQPSHSCRR